MSVLKFPKNFLWGSATAAHQVEGGLKNDWSEWEKNAANKLARNAFERLKYISRYISTTPNWNKVKREATLPTNYISARASDHYNRFKEDLDLAHELNHNAYRFSIEWSRIQPAPRVFDDKEIRHYRQVVVYCKKLRIEPVITLFHFTLPLWVSKKGGWENPETPKLFASFAEKIAKEFKDVNYWTVLNEPMAYVANSYGGGLRPPEVTNIFRGYKVARLLIEGHKRAYLKLKKHNRKAKIGVAKHLIYFQIANRNPVNKLLAGICNRVFNLYFLDKISNHLDFIGVNYYFRNLINMGINKSDYKGKVSDLGWELYPEGIYHICLQLTKRYGKPLLITEHGLADSADKHRSWYITETLKYLQKAMRNGANVIGYLHWSLMDNFEWDFGFWPRFGLLEVNYKTQSRRIRPSARTLSKIIEASRMD